MMKEKPSGRQLARDFSAFMEPYLGEYGIYDKETSTLIVDCQEGTLLITIENINTLH
jgi:hypothetical protein